jgi:tetratricopeptide (TPR) repeat protein
MADERTRRWGRLPRPETSADPYATTVSREHGEAEERRGPESIDPLQVLRTMIAGVRAQPRDPEARRRLRASAAEYAAWEQLAPLLADEARAADRPEVAAAFIEELADVHDQLDQPLEVIAAMEAVIGYEPDHPDHHDRLAWLYRRAGAWAKAAEAFERVGELDPGERGRAARRAAGALYREHGQLDQARHVYRGILDRWPSDAEAWQALDRVLVELGRWREVAELRGERAARSHGVDRAALLRSQARALERAGELEEATGVVAEAARHAPGDLSGLVDYAEVLARAGRGHEAAKLLEARIAAATKGDAATEPAPPVADRAGAAARAGTGSEPNASRPIEDRTGTAPMWRPPTRAETQRRASTERLARAPDPVPLWADEATRTELTLIDSEHTARTRLTTELDLVTGGEPPTDPAQLALDAYEPEGWRDAAGGAAEQLDIQQLAALRLRLATILDETCDDRAAAVAALEELLAETPAYPPALERLAALAARDPDPRVHAAALLRYARVQPAEARAPAIVAAARRFRDARDLRAAVGALEEASELAPDDDALRAELDEARAAAVVERAAADPDREAAERRLRSVLATRPRHLDAHLALADLLAGTGRCDEAARHLRDTLAATPDGAPELAPLVHRLATIVAALGDHDEAHHLLHEAHRIDRKALAITLALGESCFARRLWREAGRYLGSLAGHPDAPAHAEAVARGLTHAALAEIRALRPAHASAHYEAAVRIDPRCAPAWRGLAELAMERGELARGAECVEREALATMDADERARRLEAAGDLAQDALGDLARAERCWVAVLDPGVSCRLGRESHPPLASAARRIPVLEKLLVLQRGRGAPERASTCEHLAELVPADRARSLLEEAATAHAEALHQGHVAAAPRARDLAERLIATHPRDLDTVLAATAVSAALGDTTRTLAWARRVLPSEPVGDDPRHALLWRRVGDAERARGNTDAARQAYQHAVALAPESDAALAARRGLVGLADPDTATSQRALHVSLVELVEVERDPDDALALARRLARDDAEAARCMFDLAVALGGELADDDRRFLASHPPRTMASDEGYPRPLGEERRVLVDDPADDPLASLLALLGEAAPLVCPDPASALATAGYPGANRLSATGDAAATAMLPQIAKLLGGPPVLVFAHPRAELEVLLAAPPAIIMGPRLASLRARTHGELDTTDDAGLRFSIARIVELSRPQRVFAASPELPAIVAGLAALAGRAGETVWAERLRGKLSISLRRRLAERLEAAGSLDPSAYVAACDRAADRAGLIACGDLGVAVTLAGGRDRATHLIDLAASRRYLELRQVLAR